MRRKFLSIVLALVTATSLVACGGDPAPKPDGGDDVRPQGTVITIYAGGSSEFSWVKGSKEDEVIEYIEQKYYEDTHVSLDFQISYLGQDMKTRLNGAVAGGDIVDIAISHTRGGDGIDDFMIMNNLYYDIADDLYDYGANVLKYIEGEPLDAVTTDENKVVGIPSAISPYKFGILVRKDRMNAVGYTDDPADTDKILVDNLEDFYDMCVKINQKYKTDYAVSGAIWDLEKALTLGAFCDAGRYTVKADEATGQVRNGDLFEEYLGVAGTEYKWAKNGVISKNADSILKEDAEQEFFGEKTSVFVLDPTIQHLIQVARSCKEINPEAEFTVLPALRAYRDADKCPKDADGQAKKGFMRNTWATFMASVLKSSPNSTAIVKFLNWVFKSEENYNLCRYGVEGVHWINNGDGTYSYPSDDYIMNPPYSGILTLVENQRRSNLTYKGYTDEEKRWIAIAADESNYIDNELIDYLLPYNGDLELGALTASSEMRSSVLSPAWSGAIDPLANDGEKFKSRLKVCIESAKANSEYEYKAYKTMKNSREARDNRK